MSTDVFRIEAESDEYVVTTVRAVAPRRRDFWRILLGRYEPRLVKERRFTAKGMDRELKNIYTEPLREALNQPSTLLDSFDHDH